MVFNSAQLIKSCGTETHPAVETESIGLPADAQLAAFFARHLDYFILTQNSHPSPGLDTIKIIYHDQTTPVHLPGLAKNSPTRAAVGNSIKPPGRYV
jgi:hypothetical protein